MSERKRPALSVVMSVYNNAEFLRTAIESILRQSFNDFEFIIINDGSSDQTKEIIEEFTDPRIVILTNAGNRGLVYSLNTGLQISRGEFIARMDGDDRSLPERFESQINFLRMHPNIGMVGSYYIKIDNEGNPIGVVSLPIENAEIQEALTLKSCFCHPSVMFRKSCIEKAGCYSDTWEKKFGCTGAEDWDLWLRFSEIFQLANIPISLIEYRINPKGLTQSKLSQQRMVTRLIMQNTIERWKNAKNYYPSEEALANSHIYVALEYLIEGDVGNASNYINAAIRVSEKHFFNDFFIQQFIVDRIVEWLYANDKGVDNHSEVIRGEELIKKLFSLILVNKITRIWNRRKYLAHYYIATAFLMKNNRQYKKIRATLIAGLISDPSWIRNRGVISLLFQSYYKKN